MHRYAALCLCLVAPVSAGDRAAGRSPGSEEAIFQPHMPEVDVPADAGALFAQARKDASGATRQLVVVTPGRMRMAVPAPDPGSLPREMEENARGILGDRPLDVTVIGYTEFQALMHDRESALRSMNRCIPFTGILIGLAYVGHSIVVFEGHPSAFEAGVRNSDVLIIDSAMLPFLQKDWISTLPFKYDRLDAGKVMEMVLRLAKPAGFFRRSLVVKAKLALSRDEARDVSFKITEGRSSDGKRQLDIELM